MKQMNELEIRNRKIIDAILEKEKRLCPGAIALIGIYGSFQTGDIHPLSDLDLLILINDDRGWQLGRTFIQDDLQVGHDIYCTSWESLRQDARYEHPNIAKLMDSRIVYCADEKYRAELQALRDQVQKKLSEPFGEADYQNADNELNKARSCYADAMTAEDLNEIRRFAGGVLYYAENALALLNKTYFQRGVRRAYDELSAMKRRPENLCALIDAVLNADSIGGVYLDLPVCTEETVRKVQESGRKAYIMMPPVWRADTVRVFEKTVDSELAEMADGFLLRSFDQIGYLRRSFIQTDGQPGGTNSGSMNTDRRQ